MIKFNTNFRIAAIAITALSSIAGGALAQADQNDGRSVEQPATGAQMEGLGQLQAINMANGTVTIEDNVFQLSKSASLVDAQNKRVSAAAFGSGETISFVFEFRSKSAARPDNMKPDSGMVVEVRKLGGGF